MKKFFLTLVIMLTMGISISHSQVRNDSWAFGFGLSFPRFYSVNETSLNSDYGAYIAIQRVVSTHVGLRFKLGYNHLEGQWNDIANNAVLQTTGLITGDFDLMLYLVPCEPVSPYVYVGIGGNHKSITNPRTGSPDGSNWGSQMNFGFGSDFKLNKNWSFTAEFGYHITNNSELDGAISPSELNGRDSYLVLHAGAKFLFDLGTPAAECEPCKGLSDKVCTDMTDYNRIEEMIVKHIPKEVVKEVVVDKYIVAVSNDRLVLIGVNFAFDKSDLLPESYPVLDQSVKLLNDKPEVNVEIEGYTDYVGTDEYNQTLSVARAQTVKTYLASKGIANARLTVVGYGKNNPVADNNTDEGRRMNRRIVFKIVK